MYNEDTDVIFPPRVIPTLQDLRGKDWHELVDDILNQPPASPDRLAFVLMMTRLNGCMTCHADSFRAMRGCTQCAIQNVRRFRGNDMELVNLFQEARKEIETNLISTY